MATEELVVELRRIVPGERVVSEAAELFVYESDGFTIAKARPGAVVFAESTEEVVKLIQLLGKLGIQIVPRGTGTGLAGGCVAFDEGVVISTARMNKVLKIDVENRAALVEAG